MPACRAVADKGHAKCGDALPASAHAAPRCCAALFFCLTRRMSRAFLRQSVDVPHHHHVHASALFHHMPRVIAAAFYTVARRHCPRVPARITVSFRLRDAIADALRERSNTTAAVQRSVRQHGVVLIAATALPRYSPHITSSNAAVTRQHMILRAPAQL